MADVKWIKLQTDIFDHRKIRHIETMPEGDAIIVIWLNILCLAGNSNRDGMIYFTEEIPYTEEMLVTEFRRPAKTVQLALMTFRKFGMIETIDDIICISNWEKYQSADKLAAIREQTRLRVEKHRNKKAVCNAKTVTQALHVTDGNAIELRTKNLELRTKNIESTFNTFWNEYPKKVAKAAAYKSWAKVDPKLYDTIMAALTTQKASEDWTKENGKFIPHPTTWLNQQRWEDELSCGLPKRKEKILSD